MVAFPLAPFLTRAGITALGAGAAGEGIKSLQNINPDVAEQAFLRTIIGPISDIFNRTTDTPSGKVFAPTGEVIEPNQIPGIAPPEQQQGITGLPIPEKVPGLPGLINPEQVDTSILNKEEISNQPVKPDEDLPVEDIQKQIQVKKSKMKNTYDFIYNGKIIGQIEKRDEKFKGLNDYNLIDTSISEGGSFDSLVGFNDAKSYMLKDITNKIKNKEIDLNDYKLIEDFYGDIKKENTSKSVGSLIDKDTVKVFRGDTTDKEKNFTSKDFYKKNPVMEYFDKQNMGEKFQEINKKRDVTRGRWFTTDKKAAESYKDKESGVLLEAEISKKDLEIGKKMKNRYFKDVETDDNTILLPRKNLKDVKKNTSKSVGSLIDKPLSDE